NKGAIF
nr:Chain Z, Amyloid beta A4 protein [Homo sapiens]